MRAVRPLTVALLTGAVLLGAVPLAHATFLRTASSESTFTAAALAAPSNLSPTKTCPVLGVLGGSITLRWTPSTTSWATGQRARLTAPNGTVLVDDLLSSSATSKTFALTTLFGGGTYTGQVTAKYGPAWSTAAPEVAIVC